MSTDHGDTYLPDDFMAGLRITDEPVPADAVIPPMEPGEEIVYLDPRDP